MREMTDAEMRALVARARWATICTASPDGEPYAVEATPYREGDEVCFMINPRGGTWRNLYPMGADAGHASGLGAGQDAGRDAGRGTGPGALEEVGDGAVRCGAGSHPGGGRVLLKFTLTNRALTWWAGVSCYGTGWFDSDPQAIRRGFRLLGEVMGSDYSGAGERFAAAPGRSPLLRVRVERMTGRCSAAEGDALFGATMEM